MQEKVVQILFPTLSLQALWHAVNKYPGHKNMKSR